MSYKPSRCPDCGENVQKCCCQAWAKNSQDKLDKENSILREALERIARGDTTCSKWVTTMPHCEDVAKEALKKVGGKG